MFNPEERCHCSRKPRSDNYHLSAFDKYYFCGSAEDNYPSLFVAGVGTACGKATPMSFAIVKPCLSVIDLLLFSPNFHIFWALTWPRDSCSTSFSPVPLKLLRSLMVMKVVCPGLICPFPLNTFRFPLLAWSNVDWTRGLNPSLFRKLSTLVTAVPVMLPPLLKLFPLL